MMIKFLFFGFFSFASFSALQLDSSILNASAVKWIKYQGSGEFDNYLAMNLNFQPVAKLFQEWQRQARIPLINRGEAHITVITPVEYWNILRPRGISMSEVNSVAEKMNLQASKFKVFCLGQGNAVLENKTESTFFLVVQSEDLIKIRSAIQKLFVKRGGSAKEFDPYHYYPHITLGFTKVDLHEHQGVIKSSKSCVRAIKLVR